MKDFIRWIAIVLILGALISLFPIFKTDSTPVLWALIAAPIVATLNFISGVTLAEKGFRASQTAMMKMVLGGMGVRLLVLGAVVATAYTVQQIDFMAFLIALFLYYAVMLGLEVYYLNTRLKNN